MCLLHMDTARSWGISDLASLLTFLNQTEFQKNLASDVKNTVLETNEAIWFPCGCLLLITALPCEGEKLVQKAAVSLLLPAYSKLGLNSLAPTNKTDISNFLQYADKAKTWTDLQTPISQFLGNVQAGLNNLSNTCDSQREWAHLSDTCWTVVSQIGACAVGVTGICRMKFNRLRQGPVAIWLPCASPQQRCFLMCANGFSLSESSSDDDGPTGLNSWNPMLDLVAHHMIGLHFEMLLSDAEMGRLALSCHFSSDILCVEAHNATTWYAEVEPWLSKN